jgi:hypothetical protein
MLTSQRYSFFLPGYRVPYPHPTGEVSMRLGYSLNNNKTIVVGFATVLSVLFLGYETHTRWIFTTAQLDPSASLRFFRFVADLAAVAACLFACITLGRVAWRIRRQIYFGTTG